MRKSIEITCTKCKKPFQKAISEVKRNKEKGRNNYCSRRCAAFTKREIKIKTPNCNCSMCGTKFYKNNSKMKTKTGLHFCSRSCKDEALKIENGFTPLHPDHYGTDRKQKYREIAFKNLDNKCHKCGYDRYIEILEVHHKDRNRENNKVENLEILCPTCHEEEHLLKNDGRFTKTKKIKVQL